MLRAADLQRIARYQRERVARARRRRAPWTAHDLAIRAEVAATGSDTWAMAASLVDYFWRAWQHYVDVDGTLADYPGWPSIYGATNDAVEGVSRPAPLWAAYATLPQADPGRREAMLDALQRMLVHGTDPHHRGYWGDIVDRSTLICEAADLALALWLAREELWPRLDEAQRRHVLQWFAQAVGKRTADNNWHLFVVLIDAVLVTLDPAHRFQSADRLQRVREFARGDGCFVDGPGGQIDFYNAWGFHYLLFWLGEIGRDLLDPALTASLGEFCRWYQWLFTDHGLPLFGRSLCYRFAACTPLLSCALRDPQTVPPGVALSALRTSWQHFVREGGLRAGRPTQGVFGDDLRWLDPYSGPASSLWGTRSLVVFLYAARVLDWRATDPLPLPAHQADAEIHVAALGATVRTVAQAGESEVAFAPTTSATSTTPVARRPTLREHLREALYGVAARPANNLLKAGCIRFSSTLVQYR